MAVNFKNLSAVSSEVPPSVSFPDGAVVLQAVPFPPYAIDIIAAPPYPARKRGKTMSRRKGQNRLFALVNEQTVHRITSFNTGAMFRGRKNASV